MYKEQRSMGQSGRDHTSNFSQVQATARRETLLLLWWIDGKRVVVEHRTLAQQGRQWLRAYGRLALKPRKPKE